MPTRKAISLPRPPSPTDFDPRQTAIFVLVVTGLNQQPGGSPPVIRPVRLDDDLLGKVLTAAQQQLGPRLGADPPNQVDPLRPLQGLAAFRPPFDSVAPPGMAPPPTRRSATRKAPATPQEGTPKKGKLTR